MNILKPEPPVSAMLFGTDGNTYMDSPRLFSQMGDFIEQRHAYVKVKSWKDKRGVVQPLVLLVVYLSPVTVWQKYIV